MGFECGEPEPGDGDGFAMVHRDGLGLQLVTASPEHPTAPATIWIQVDDAAAEHERVRSLATIEWGPEVYWYGCREFSVRDPDGHHLIFSSPTNEAPTCKQEDDADARYLKVER
jgi:MerR family transcriptional regulator, thiopeptide resistance regulator